MYIYLIIFQSPCFANLHFSVVNDTKEVHSSQLYFANSTDVKTDEVLTPPTKSVLDKK